jgi:hypothetical protein
MRIKIELAMHKWKLKANRDRKWGVMVLRERRSRRWGILVEFRAEAVVEIEQ